MLRRVIKPVRYPLESSRLRIEGNSYTGFVTDRSLALAKMALAKMALAKMASDSGIFFGRFYEPVELSALSFFSV